MLHAAPLQILGAMWGIKTRGAMLLGMAATLAFGCGEAEAPADSGSSGMDGALEDSGAVGCERAPDCDDGLFCNGEERCAPGEAGADAEGCVAGEAPCAAGESCDESAGRCSVCAEADADGDGHDSVACAGDDCDDADPNRYPGNTEICDVADHDEDCDPSTFGFRDQDMDGVADAACCNEDGDEMRCGTDCDDLSPAVRPTGDEDCDSVDNDCDGAVDEGTMVDCYADADGDGWPAEAATSSNQCRDVARPSVGFCPFGFTDRAPDPLEPDDCNDAIFAINPAASEVCESIGVDENCNGETNEDCQCSIGTSRSCAAGGFLGECAAGNQSCQASATWGDCDIAPTPESCDGEDDDCDGRVDETTLTLCWADGDGDGFAAETAAMTSNCTGSCPGGTTSRAPSGASNIDCNDSQGVVFPGNVEVCDRWDSDCSEGGGVRVAEDADNDGHTAIGFSGCVVTASSFPADDCREARRRDDIPQAFTGQTQFFPDGFCDVGAVRCDECEPDRRCAVGSCGAPGSCGPSHTPERFDYDCNGDDEEEVINLASQCLAQACAPPIANCPSGLWSVNGGLVRCGVTVVRDQTCTCAGAGLACAHVGPQPANRLLGCR